MSAPSREHAGAAQLRAYEDLCAHAEHELELAGRGDLDGLAALAARGEQLRARLPEVPPAAAAAAIERARLLHARTRVELLRMRDLVLAELATTGRARRAADGYAGQLRRRPRLDRSA